MNHFITLDKAVQMTTVYRNEKENILDPIYRNQNILALAESFERSPFDQILAQEGCAGLRIYYGMDESLNVHAIIVGTDANGNDIIPTATNTSNDDDTGIIEEGSRCPPLCVASPLNP